MGSSPSPPRSLVRWALAGPGPGGLGPGPGPSSLVAPPRWAPPPNPQGDDGDGDDGGGDDGGGGGNIHLNPPPCPHAQGWNIPFGMKPHFDITPPLKGIEVRLYIKNML